MMQRMIGMVVGGLFVAVAGLGTLGWIAFRVYVPEDQCAVLIRKTGSTGLRREFF